MGRYKQKKLVIIGAGWAGFYLCEHLSSDLYNVVVIAPRRTSAFTPLLASAAVGLFNFYLAEEPIRAKSREDLNFFKANVIDIDFAGKKVACSPAFDDDEELSGTTFDVNYDILLIAPGCRPNTFNTPGVAEHAIFMKNVSDAMAVRKLLFDLLEKASLPNVSEEKMKQLLHIAIVGGGPTGIELTAELDDLCRGELRALYPKPAAYLKISISDLAPNILSAYDKKLYEYANTQLAQRSIDIQTSTRIEKVDAREMSVIHQQSGQAEKVPYGMLLWVTGNKSIPLVDSLSVKKTGKGLTRILTDPYLRVFSAEANDQTIDGCYALGDAADIEGASLPTTAEVAIQKAKYLVEALNSNVAGPSEPFKWKQKGLVSYIGGHDGIMMGNEANSEGWTGKRAWLAWRSGSVMWTRSWRNRLAILITWVLNWLFGTDIAKL